MSKSAFSLISSGSGNILQSCCCGVTWPGSARRADELRLSDRSNHTAIKFDHGSSGSGARCLRHRLTGAPTSPSVSQAKLFSAAALLDWPNTDEEHCDVFKALPTDSKSNPR